jgi:hypothetical protein
MASIVSNYMDLYVQNGLVELSAGVVALLLPQLMFPGSKSVPHAHLLARWWASAVVAIGIISLLFSTRTSTF